MTMISTQTSYSTYKSQTVTQTTKDEEIQGGFQSALIDASDKKDKTIDLFDFEYFNTLSKEEKIEHRKEISKEYGLQQAMAFGTAAQFGDINMQKAVYEKTSTMSEEEMFTFSFDIHMGAKRYLSGMELKASYSVVIENGYINHGSDNVDTNSYFENMSPNEFNYFFSTMYESHSSLASVVGKKQTMPYANTYKDILASYKDSLEDSSIINENYKKETNSKSQTTDIDKLRALAEDIFSLLKTGLTVAEVEEIQELLAKLKEKIKEGDYSKEEIEKMLSEAEKAIIGLQKRVTGQAIIEEESGNLKREDINVDDKDTAKFLERIDKAINRLEKLKVAINNKESAANESEVLAMIKEFQK